MYRFHKLALASAVLLAAAADIRADDGVHCKQERMQEFPRLSLENNDKRQYQALLSILKERYRDLLHSEQIVAALPGCWQQFIHHHPEYAAVRIEYDGAAAGMNVKSGDFSESFKSPPLGKLASKIAELVDKVGRKPVPEKTADALWFVWTEAALAVTSERYNFYVYADELPWQEAMDEGRSFIVGFKPRFEGNDIYVKEIIDNSLSSQGLKVGDKIERITGRETTDVTEPSYWWTRQQPFDYSLHYLSAGKASVLEAASVPYLQASIHTALWENIAYVHISFFTRRTAIELWRFLRDLDKDIKGIIVDVRNNGGGALNPQIIDFFLRTDQIIMVQQEIGHEPETVHGSLAYVSQPMVVLQNRHSASMSELLAAALQKQQRATIVGEKSHGKAVGQTGYPVRDEGVLMLVRVRYFYPDGKSSWADTGVIPDIQITPEAEENAKVTEILLGGKIDVSALAKTDSMFKAAIRLLRDSL